MMIQIDNVLQEKKRQIKKVFTIFSKTNNYYTVSQLATT